jgi:hypothetical protein
VTPIVDVVVAYFEARAWTVVAVSETTLSTPVEGANGTWVAFTNVREEQRQLLVHSVFPEDVPEDRRTEMALFVTRANFGMVIGCFELDLDDGELRFKTSIDVDGAELTDPLIDHVMLANASMMDRYVPGIRSVLDGMPADLAIAAIDGRA